MPSMTNIEELTPEQLKEKTDRAIRLVSKLLAKAEDPATPAVEKENIEENIKRLVEQYRIDEQNLIARDQFSIVPVTRDIVMCPLFFEGSPILFDFTGFYYSMFLSVCQHTGLRNVLKTDKIDGRWQYVGQVVGYDSDIRYAEMIWMNIRMTFIASVDVRVNPKLTDEENIYLMRSAGIVRKDVAAALWGEWTHSNSAKVAKVYEAECRKRGQAPAVSGRGVSKKLFREIFAREFMVTIQRRLIRMADGTMGTAGVLDIAGREQKVEDKFYEIFPDLRPKPMTMDPNAEPAPEAEKARKRVSKRVGPTKAEMREWDRRTNSSAALAGSAAGVAAAKSVVFTRTADSTGRVESDQNQSSVGDRLPIEG